ncbi:hypothetical protein GCM10011572_23370 [Pseudoduganella buxea]|uniref:Uncharacterized protein n=2 Tax=Pseudoduganella buxea TaxID=1949069 RepID=A0ABQ1KLA8_9BURK|nr:hypothetical protein GCM10011572_23370 [Pseudoduganella buxea]
MVGQYLAGPAGRRLRRLRRGGGGMKFWAQRKAGTAAAEAPSAAFRPLRIAARAMCCAVGHNAQAPTAAINARLNHFRETGFVAPGGTPLAGGALYELDAWGRNA